MAPCKAITRRSRCELMVTTAAVACLPLEAGRPVLQPAAAPA